MQYKKQKREVIDSYKGFQTMDSKEHPVVQQGIKAAELMSDVRIVLLNATEYTYTLFLQNSRKLTEKTGSMTRIASITRFILRRDMSRRWRLARYKAMWVLSVFVFDASVKYLRDYISGCI